MMSLQPATAPERPTRVRWLMFALACGGSWFLYLHRYTWNIIGPELKDSLGLDNAELGTLFTVFNVVYAAGQVPSGVVIDYFGLDVH